MRQNIFNEVNLFNIFECYSNGVVEMWVWINYVGAERTLESSLVKVYCIDRVPVTECREYIVHFEDLEDEDLILERMSRM